MEDKYNYTVDKVLCDPEKRAEFDLLAQEIAPGISAYLLRKAALRLRKSRKLRPELVKKATDWGRQVVCHRAEDLLDDLELIPRLPGIYIFRDDAGYLYIGEASNLRGRVAQHLDHSDRKAVARYLWEKGTENLSVELHSFDRNSDGRTATCRKAYEAELIRSRKPRLNIQALDR